MSKAILMIDMPENCDSCPFLVETEASIVKLFWCPIIMQAMWNRETKKRKEECPLKLLPERKIVTPDDTTAAVAIKYGWNNCIDEILKEVENE